jgi:uncharacterized membrane protein YccC
MTSRQRIRGLIFAAAFAALGIWALAEARYGTGAFWLVIGVAWLLLALFRTNSSPPGNGSALASGHRSSR